MRRATIRQLQVFVEAARLLSFARVSERLHLTPAAVSFQIKQLESITGSALFERIGKRVRLTDAGHLLLGYAEMIINALGDAGQVLSSYNFQLPTISAPPMAPNSRSVKRDSPLHITTLPGAGSLARFR